MRLKAMLGVVVCGCGVAMGGEPVGVSLFGDDLVFDSDPSVAGDPSAVRIGDMNGDGIDDIVTMHDTGEFEIRHGDGAGGFSGPVLGEIDIFGTYLEFEILDANGDALNDLVVVSEAGGIFVVMVNMGGGVFERTLVTWNGSITNHLVSGDLDNDGDRDLVVIDRFLDAYTVVLNHGAKGMEVFADVPCGDRPSGGAMGDVNGDGLVDLVITIAHEYTVEVYLNTGDPGLGSSMLAFDDRYSVGALPWGANLADMDGDGDLDIVCSNLDSEDVSVLMNHGDGTFAPESFYTLGDDFQDTKIADVDGDGDLDVVCRFEDFRAQFSVVLFNDGSGVLGAPVYGPSGREDVGIALGDLNGDGRMDLVSASDISGSTRVFFGREGGMYGAGRRYVRGDGLAPTMTEFARSFWVDCDGEDGEEFVLHEIEPTRLRIYGFDAQSGFTSLGVIENVGFHFDIETQVVDLDADGDEDLYVHDTLAGRLTFYENVEGGLFELRGSQSGFFKDLLMARDFDQDGDLDLMFRTFSSPDYSLWVLRNEGGFDFELQEPVFLGGFVQEFEFADVNGDTFIDLVGFVNSPDERTVVMEGDGLGGFGAQLLYNSFMDADSIELLDYEGDGDIDVKLVGLVPGQGRRAVGIMKNISGTGQFNQREYFYFDEGLDGTQIDLDGDGVLDFGIFTDEPGFVFGLADSIGTYDRVVRFAPAYPGFGDWVDVDGDGDLDYVQDNTNDQVDVYLNSAMDCPVDLNSDGGVDFFDLSELLTGQLDYNGDTSFDFFDLSAFLGDFAQGCP